MGTVPSEAGGLSPFSHLERSPLMSRFRPVTLSQYYNSPAVFPESAGSAWHPRSAGCLAALPRGSQTSWGIPFRLGKQPLDQPCVVALGAKTGEIKVKLSGTATHLCFLQLANLPDDYLT